MHRCHAYCGLLRSGRIFDRSMLMQFFPSMPNPNVNLHEKEKNQDRISPNNINTILIQYQPDK